MKKLLALILALALVLALTACNTNSGGSSSSSSSTSSASESMPEPETVYLKLEGWDPTVKQGLDDLFDLYGITSEGYDETKRPYAVFDFDNTCSIFDIEEQLAAYQLEHLAFAFTADQAYDIFMTGLPAETAVGADAGYLVAGANSGATFETWAKDCAAAYAKLYEKYNPTAAGITDDDTLSTLHEDDDWKEFSSKLRSMYDVLYDNLSADIAYPWVLYWFTGMSYDEVYDLAFASHKYYGSLDDADWGTVTWTGPSGYGSTLGAAAYTWTRGIAVTDEVLELWAALDANGFDSYVCSASFEPVVNAACDFFGIDEYADGVIAMTLRQEDGKYVNEYDYDVSGAQTQGLGKVTAINNMLVPEHGRGPVLCLMDSSGDFNFCTEYEDTRMVVCFNRLRKATDGGGLAAVVARAQKEKGVDLAEANAAGDTYYVLQGRNENGGTLTGDDLTYPLGSEEAVDWKNEDIRALYDYFMESDMTVKEFFDRFAIKTAADDPENDTGIKYGFLTEYAGYKNIVF